MQRGDFLNIENLFFWVGCKFNLVFIGSGFDVSKRSGMKSNIRNQETDWLYMSLYKMEDTVVKDAFGTDDGHYI